jgi:hypothetical protein
MLAFRRITLEAIITMANPLLLPLLTWAKKLRFPTLFWLMATLFAIDLVVPDLVPGLDEILLGLGTLLFASWKSRKQPPPLEQSNHNAG